MACRRGLDDGRGHGGKRREPRGDARRRRRGGGPVPRARRTVGPVHRAADRRQRPDCSTATWTARPPRTPRPAACSRSSGTARTCPRSSSGSPRSPPGRVTWPGPVSCPRPPGRPRSRTGSPIDRGIAAAWWAGFEVAWGDIDAARPLHADTERLLARFSPAHPAREHLEAMVAATGALIAIADKDTAAPPASRPPARTARRSPRRTCRCSRWRRARWPSSPSRSASRAGRRAARRQDRGARRRRPDRPDGAEAGAAAARRPRRRTATRPPTPAARRSAGRRRSSALTRPGSTQVRRM